MNNLRQISQAVPLIFFFDVLHCSPCPTLMEERMLPRSGQTVIDTIKHAASLHSGAAHRALQAQFVIDHCNGNPIVQNFSSAGANQPSERASENTRETLAHSLMCSLFLRRTL